MVAECYVLYIRSLAFECYNIYLVWASLSELHTSELVLKYLLRYFANVCSGTLLINHMLKNFNQSARKLAPSRPGLHLKTQFC